MVDRVSTPAAGRSAATSTTEQISDPETAVTPAFGRGGHDALEPARRVRRWWNRRRAHHRLARLPAYRRHSHRQFDVLLHFPDLPVNLYQVRQWYGPLEYLSRQRSVAVLCYEPETAEIVRAETSLPVVLIRGAADLNHVRKVHRPKVILYPNQNYTNFGILGLNSCQHAFICHGESDKIYMASNWMKVFNYDLVAGPAAKDRLRRRLFDYDVDARTIEIGRPQIDVEYSAPIMPDRHRTTILYAPTWEGGRTSMRYGSVASHGIPMVESLLGDPSFRLIYRPHPRTGIAVAEHGACDLKIRQMIEAANAADPQAGHLIDNTAFGWHLTGADLMITDVSAVAYDWLTTAKPLVVTQPAEDSAVIDPTTFLADLPLLNADQAHDIVAVVRRALTDPEQIAKMRNWSAYYYGDTTPGASLNRFTQAVERMIAERDEWVHRKHPVPKELARIGRVVA
ncbi:CDP-glycerol glycerophosphotransferase family protein [Microlunatus soli]|uniref:CDP-Glycerol:Poly(Glycerophosphate) glycerophosphotransferase n=1 Tax=Microlunatus soli TaxID=630515 RepID=A0A1H1MAS4_9ACTN|nr:CDP-glycerol glycerophosphotransferase family protein [Microlunatus soli]SDR83079.1 CDP-Glycerol:Poly(glycerophosphate) glycerophosphotransferase [Microlunatus soli]